MDDVALLVEVLKNPFVELLATDVVSPRFVDLSSVGG